VAAGKYLGEAEKILGYKLQRTPADLKVNTAMQNYHTRTSEFFRKSKKV